MSLKDSRTEKEKPDFVSKITMSTTSKRKKAGKEKRTFHERKLQHFLAETSKNYICLMQCSATCVPWDDARCAASTLTKKTFF